MTIEQKLKFNGYCFDIRRTILFSILSVFPFAGFPFVLVTFSPLFLLKATHKRCSLHLATKILVQNEAVSSVQVVSVSTKSCEFLCDEFSAHKYQQSDARSDVFHLLTTDSGNHTGYYMKYFFYNSIKYVWSFQRECFCHVSGLDYNISLNALLTIVNNCTGLSTLDQSKWHSFYGFNEIGITVKSYSSLFFYEVFNPFYLFQLFSIVLWYLDQYYIYSSCIFLISMMSILISLRETRRQSECLKDIAKYSMTNILVRKANQDLVFNDVINLVPGDVIVLSNDITMPCDALLLNESCLVDESMLTGESAAASKFNIQSITDNHNLDDELCFIRHRKSILFSGTKVIQLGGPKTTRVFALVLRTGFSTVRGRLICDMLLENSLNYAFYRDCIHFVYILACISAVGMLYTLYLLIGRNVDWVTIVMRVLDIVTIVVPPALPAALTVSSIYAQRRLKEESIYCASPLRINVCASLDLFCFDKTGTLTENYVTVEGVMLCESHQTAAGVREVCADVITPVTRLPDEHVCKQILATCHSLNRLHGELVGDPMEAKIFISTQWDVKEESEVLDLGIRSLMDFDDSMDSHSNKSEHRHIYCNRLHPRIEIEVVKLYPFDSYTQCMSVLITLPNSCQMSVYCKGAPERIRDLCGYNTVPTNFLSSLNYLTSSGYRVLALAYKNVDLSIDINNTKRDQIESDLIFVGFLAISNPLKPSSVSVMESLRHASIRTIMLTGDSLDTALTVAYRCSLIPAGCTVVHIDADFTSSLSVPPLKFTYCKFFNTRLLKVSNDEVDVSSIFTKSHRFACTGITLSLIIDHYPKLFDHVLLYAVVIGRAKPEIKADVVKRLQKLDYTVGMCGDGLNDCQALHCADVGVAIDTKFTETNLSAPFTVDHHSLLCLLTLLRQARCSLVATYATFKYMALYSLIQFCSVILLYATNTNLGDWQFVYIDLVLTTLLALTMSRTECVSTLSSRSPATRLLSASNVCSILLQVIFCAIGQMMGLVLLRLQPWYASEHVPLPSRSVEFEVCWENTLIFLISSFQYLTLAFTFNSCSHFRLSVLTNRYFTCSLLILCVSQIFLTLYPTSFLSKWLGIIPPHSAAQFCFFVVTVMLISAVHLFISLLIEYLLDEVIDFSNCAMCIVTPFLVTSIPAYKHMQA